MYNNQLHAYYSLYNICVSVLKYIVIINTEFSIYKICMHDISNVHLNFFNVQRYSHVSIRKYFSFQIEISKGILVLFVHHHTLIFGTDTLVTSSKILLGS